MHCVVLLSCSRVGLRRIVFKTALNYRLNFSRCRDGTRATIVVRTLVAVLRLFLALLDSAFVVVVRVKNRYAEDYDSVPLGG